MIKVIIDSSGITELLKSNEILDFLMKTGEKVAQRAGNTFEAQEWMRPTRAVCNVVDTRENAMFIEAEQGNLARAIGER